MNFIPVSCPDGNCLTRVTSWRKFWSTWHTTYPLWIKNWSRIIVLIDFGISRISYTYVLIKLPVLQLTFQEHLSEIRHPLDPIYHDLETRLESYLHIKRRTLPSMPCQTNVLMVRRKYIILYNLLSSCFLELLSRTALTYICFQNVI